MRTQCLCLMLTVAVAAAGGCNLAAWPLAVFGKPAMKTVPAEVPIDLTGKTVAVVVYAGPETQVDYETVHVEVSDAVAAEIRRNLRDVTLVSPIRVLRYQNEHPNWNSTRLDRMCGDLRCDYILLVTLIEFSTREPGSVHLARGRLTAEASLYAAKAVRVESPEVPTTGEAGGGCTWRSDTFRIVYPNETPVSLAGDDYGIRIQTERQFAEALIRKFYDHQVPMTPEEAS